MKKTKIRFLKSTKKKKSKVKPLKSNFCLSCGFEVPACTGNIVIVRNQEKRICNSCLE